MSYYHNVLIESTVQYSTVLVAGICLSILSCRLEMHAYDLTLKKTVLFYSSMRSLSRDNYHGYGDIIILWAWKLCLLIDYLSGNSTRVYWKALLFSTILLTKGVNPCHYFKMYFVFGKLFSMSTASVCFFSWRLSVFNSLIVLTSKYSKGYIVVIFNEKGCNNRNNRGIILVCFCRTIFQNREMRTFYCFWL